MVKNSLNNGGFFVGRRTLLIVCLLILVPLLGITCNAGDVEDYAPIFYFEGEETCYPVDVDDYLLNPGDYEEKPAGEIAGISFTCYDNLHGTVNDDGVIKDYQSKESSLGYTVYYRLDDTTEPGTTLIQYWMFYAFNKGDLNQHEGDWEMVQVVIPVSGSKWVAYSQHHSGQYATWDQVERDGTKIKVYVARGSHANYLRSFSGKLGIASDHVGNNGKVLRPTGYQLVELSNQDWLDKAVLWGEYGGPDNSILGRNGPPGPMVRGGEEGNQMWDDGLTWGNSLPKADNNFFLAEWLMYNLVTIFIVITVAILAWIIFSIHRRHKKYGLGPRILSMLYIDGPNLKSIGNILCFVGIILAILGLFYPWYTVSADVNVEGYGTGGLVDIISIDGINGIQLTVPGATGSVPMGTALIPFSLFIGISIVFLFLTCIGISHSKKIGKKYIGRGFRFMIPIIVIIIIIAVMGSLVSSAVSNMEGGDSATKLFSSISGSPMGGQESFSADYGDVSGQIGATWGLGSGGYFLLFSGVILLIAGAMEVFANKEFFTPKTPIVKPKKQKPAKPKKGQMQPVAPVESQKKEDTKKDKFCYKCGAKAEANEKFCAKCGEKL